MHIHTAITPDGYKYYETILTYVDDIIGVSHQAEQMIQNFITNPFKIKKGVVAAPEMYLGAQLEHKTINHVKCWTMTSQKYIQAAVKKIEDKLKLHQHILSTKARTPFKSGYRPESDVYSGLLVQDIRSFQEVIGILRWAVELGRINIMVEV